MLSYLNIIRPLNGVMSAFAVYIATLLAGAPFYPSDLVLYGMAVVFLVSGGGMAINDYFDVEADKINKPHRPVASGNVGRKAALAYSAILFAAGVFISYMINEYCFYTAIFASASLIAYAAKLKKVILVGHILISLLVALNFIFGGFIITTSLVSLFPIILLAALALLSNTGREIFKTIEDVMGDKRSGIHTIPMKYGVIKARMIASFFIMLAVMISFLPFFLAMFGLVYLFFVVIADIVFIAAIAMPKNLNAKLCKFAMVIALFAFLTGIVA